MCLGVSFELFRFICTFYNFFDFAVQVQCKCINKPDGTSTKHINCFLFKSIWPNSLTGVYASGSFWFSTLPDKMLGFVQESHKQLKTILYFKFLNS